MAKSDTIVRKSSDPASGKKVDTDFAKKTASSSSPSEEHYDERVAVILARDALKRDRTIFLSRICLSLTAAVFVCLFVIGMTATREDKFRYFFTNEDGYLRETVPLDRPIQDLGQVLTWVTAALVKANTYSFATYQRELTEARNDFTETGWLGYEKALKESGNLETVRIRKLNLYTVPEGAPVIQAQGLIDGKQAIRIEIPLMLTFESSTERRPQRVLVTATVIRRPMNEHPLGMGIAQIIAR